MARPLRKAAYYEPMPLVSREDCTRKDKDVRRRMSEEQIDKMLADSFPCSDPPAWY